MSLSLHYLFLDKHTTGILNVFCSKWTSHHISHGLLIISHMDFSSYLTWTSHHISHGLPIISHMDFPSYLTWTSHHISHGLPIISDMDFPSYLTWTSHHISHGLLIISHMDFSSYLTSPASPSISLWDQGENVQITDNSLFQLKDLLMF